MPDSHTPVREVRDPIYGFVTLSEAEWNIVNCPEFQRLRDIRQLAMAHFVYPGANHTRFEHSIGCVHLSTLMFDALVARSSDVLDREFHLSGDGVQKARKVLRLAALLHDVGHPPFSHSGESLLPVLPTNSGVPTTIGPGKPRQTTHEDMTARIVRESSLSESIRKWFGPDGVEVEEVISVATSMQSVGFDPHPHHYLLNELLTGELGSDRVDYLLRDAHHSGQETGRFDYRKLIGSLTLVPPPKEADPWFSVGLDEGGWLVAEQMIVARYLMYQSLYFHKTKRIYEKHLADFMRVWARQRFGVETLPSAVLDYLAVSDSVVWGDLYVAANSTDHAGHAHAKRFMNRTHMRLSRELILADNALQDKKYRRRPDKKRFDKLAECVRVKFGAEAVHCDEPDQSATHIFRDSGQILVLIDGKPRYIAEVSELVRGMSDRIWRGRIYAEESIKNEVKLFCDKWLESNPVHA